MLFPYEELVKFFQCEACDISPRGLLNCGNRFVLMHLPNRLFCSVEKYWLVILFLSVCLFHFSNFNLTQCFPCLDDIECSYGKYNERESCITMLTIFGVDFMELVDV